MPLNDQQKLFVKHYLKDKNATQAAKDAGYSKNGRSAEVIGERLLRKVEVRAAVDAGIAKQMAKADLTGDMIIAELRKIALIKMDKEETKRFSNNKLKALELLGKHFKLFTDIIESKNETKLEVVTPEMADAAYKKIKSDC